MPVCIQNIISNSLSFERYFVVSTLVKYLQGIHFDKLNRSCQQKWEERRTVNFLHTFVKEKPKYNSNHEMIRKYHKSGLLVQIFVPKILMLPVELIPRASNPDLRKSLLEKGRLL